jgi:hypothetical protein
MIIVNLSGGLGNQLFQYAFGRFLSEKNNCKLKIDISSYDNYEWHKYSLKPFYINESFADKNDCDFLKGNNISFSDKIKRKLSNHNYLCKELNLSFNTNYKHIKSPVYLEGYWQSDKYFNEIETIIRNEYKIKLLPSEVNQQILNKIVNENSISLHVRRGNFINIDYVNKIHGTCSSVYYKEAIQLLTSKVINPIFYIFSDDIEWARNNIIINHETIFVDINDSDNDYEDLRLMYSCKHHIIANSTFSWWGAWLNQSKDKIVIAPKNWFSDTNMNNQTKELIPKEWIRL